MKKSGWLLLPAAFFLLVNFSVSSVKVLFFSRLIYFLFFIVLFFILRRFTLENILPSIIGGISLIIFIYGIIQKFFLFPYYLKYIIPKENFYSQALVTRIESGRIFSLFTLPTLYAIVCTVLILFIFHYLLISRDKKSKFFWTTLMLMGLFNLLLTQSFGGALYFSVGILLYLFFSGILKFKYLAPVLMVLSLFFFITIALRFSEAKELEPIKLRLSNWKQAARMIASSPFYGIGLGNYEAKISYYTLPAEAKSMYAHNFFLQFPAESGIISFFFLLLLFFVLRKTLKPDRWKEKIVYISVFLVLLFYNVVDIGFYFFSASIAAVVVLSQIYPKPGNKLPLRKDGKFIMTMIGFAVLSLLMIGELLSQNQRNAADFLFAQEDYENARYHYEKSFKINPFNYNAMMKYAQISLHFNNLKEAETYLDWALDLYPDLAFANYLKSQVEFKKNRLFKSYYHAAAAYYEYKLNNQYKKWFEYLKRSLDIHNK